ncbi:unnamed protein product [Eruca vesicaria subsp. sativa]|uniref:Uncharacterized protein n=1 Tax=Eruca vesicaria subsp. sativa TaxID=29727 RepID=A0ABC8JCJ8_ERUVS|nr:unnamed protein product [Eruca vesicaria subsp. sativa]
MSNPTSLCFLYELSSSSLMEVNEDTIPYMQNLFQEEETSLGKRKIASIVETEDEREVKKIAFFSQVPLEEEDIDMVAEDTEREDLIDNNEIIMEENALEECCVVDFDGFF